MPVVDETAHTQGYTNSCAIGSSVGRRYLIEDRPGQPRQQPMLAEVDELRGVLRQV